MKGRMPKGINIALAILVVMTLSLSAVPVFGYDDAEAAGQVNLEAITIPEGKGTVTGTGTYDVGSLVQIRAVPNEGYIFVKWNDGSEEQTRYIVLDRDRTVTAYFERAPTAYLGIGTSEGGYVTGMEPGNYPIGTYVSLYANAYEGYKFVKWKDGSTDQVRHETLSKSKTFTAEFKSTAPPNDRVIPEWVALAILAIFGITAVVAGVYYRFR
jgi:hypothetical protein